MTGSALNDLKLPPVLRVIAEAAGVEAALKLARERGGTRIYVPHNVPADHWLVELIGIDGAIALSRLYAGENIALPLGLSGSLQAARRAARQALDAGASVAQAARASGLTERTIYNIRSDRRGPSRQLNLFED